MANEWRSADEKPRPGEWVWVHEVYYVNGTTIGQHDGASWTTIETGSDCGVDAWMPLDRPSPPGAP